MLRGSFFLSSFFLLAFPTGPPSLSASCLHAVEVFLFWHQFRLIKLPSATASSFLICQTASSLSLSSHCCTFTFAGPGRIFPVAAASGRSIDWSDPLGCGCEGTHSCLSKPPTLPVSCPLTVLQWFFFFIIYFFIQLPARNAGRWCRSRASHGSGLIAGAAHVSAGAAA